MSDCLVTKLKGVVNDDNIGHMGDIHIPFSKSVTGNAATNFTTNAEKPFSVVVVGDGNILDSGGQSLGKTHTYAGGVAANIYLDENVNEVILRAGYGITSVSCTADIYKTTGTLLITDIAKQRKITVLSVRGRTGLTIRGALSDLSALTAIKELAVMDQDNVTGDLSDVKFAKSLVSLVLSNCPNIGGDISALSELNLLTTINIGYSTAFYGDLSALSPSVRYISSTRGGVFTWVKGRDTSSPIPRMIDVNLGSYVDAALINLAQCVNTETTRSISLIGTRTSASDAAVATLQSMGWTVTVTEA